MRKMPAKERIQTRIVAASAVKRVLDFRHQLSVCPATHLKMFRQKETPIGYYAAIILNYRNVAKHLWRKPQIIKFENAFHIWINICERTLSAMSRVKSRVHARLTDCNLQSQLHAVTPFEQNFTKLVSSRQRQVFY